MTIPKIDIYDDLRANFRSWEVDCDNNIDAISLAGILYQRHPQIQLSEVQRIADEWVGFEREDEDEHYLTP